MAKRDKDTGYVLSTPHAWQKLSILQVEELAEAIRDRLTKLKLHGPNAEAVEALEEIHESLTGERMD